MPIKELQKDEYSKSLEARELDVCPVKVNGFDWLLLKIQSVFAKRYSLDDIEKESSEKSSLTRKDGWT